MKIVVGATRLNRALNTKCNHDGISVYTQGLISGLPNEITEPAIFSNVANKQLGCVHLLGGFTAFAFKSLVLGTSFHAFGKNNHPNLFHATDHFVPSLREIPVLANVHDAASLMQPAWVSGKWSRPVKNYIFKKMLSSADHYLADSFAMVADISNYFEIDENRISVVPLGVDPKYFQLVPLEQRSNLLAKLGLKKTFFIFVGTLQPRKNLGRILEAHALLNSNIRRQIPLVVVGRLGWKCEKELNLLNQAIAQSFAFWFQDVDDLSKQILLQSALALVFPSLYEGFGLPILEAFASGLPVITSNVSAMPEVAGDCALLVNPLDVEDIAFAMQRIAESPSLAFELGEKGRLRAREFTWQKTAEQTLAVYREML